MTPFEEELKKALARREPPAGFTARVLAGASQYDRERAAATGGFLQKLRSWRLIPVLAALLMMTGGIAYQEHAHEARGQAAKQQLLLAMHIAGSKLHDAQLAVREVEQ